MRCASTLSVRTGWKVPGPTCRVTQHNVTPSRSNAVSNSGVKWSPAVGAATAPGSRAYTV